MIIFLSYMFGATGRGDDMGVITGLPTPKTNRVETKFDTLCIDKFCICLFIGHTCLNFQYEIKYVIPIYMIQYQCNIITKTNPKDKKINYLLKLILYV